MKAKSENNRTFVPSPVDNWRKFLRNVSLSNKAESIYNTFIPLYVDQNVSKILESTDDGSREITDSVIFNDGEGLNMVKENDGNSNNATEGSDSFRLVSTWETQDSDNGIDGKGSPNNTQEKVDSIKKAIHLGVDVSEDVFYLLEK